MSETQQSFVVGGSPEAPDATTPDATTPDATTPDATTPDATTPAEGRPGGAETPAGSGIEDADDRVGSDLDGNLEEGGRAAAAEVSEELPAEESERGSSRGRRAGTVSLRRLEEEGEVAADYLEELLDIIDLDGDIDIDVENGRASVAIVAESGGERELRRLVGPHGEVLEALQELTRLAVLARTGDRSRLMLDVAGFRAARRRTLEDLAARICQDVRRTGEPARLDPMSAFERKVVHDVVAGVGLVSESEGEEPNRRVVVQLAAP